MNLLDKPNQFTFIRGELEVVRHERLTEERHGVAALMEHRPKIGARGVTFHHKGLIKV